MSTSLLQGTLRFEVYTYCFLRGINGSDKWKPTPNSKFALISDRDGQLEA